MTMTGTGSDVHLISGENCFIIEYELQLYSV